MTRARQSPVVVKLGGDALASPGRIAAEARRLASLAVGEPVVAVVSARRGVTDHLLSLVEGVRLEVGGHGRPHAEAERTVAAGEVVTASLLALALNDLGVPALSLDAREAGVVGTGQPGSGRISTVVPRRVERLLARGVLPVVTGFQAWRRGRVATLGRGGTDTSAVALGVALQASRGVFVKDTEGLRTGDPKLVPDSRPIRVAPHDFLTALSEAGARVLHPKAALLAERHGLMLEFCTIHRDGPLSTVRRGADAARLRAIATSSGDNGTARVTPVAGDRRELAKAEDRLADALRQRGIDADRAGGSFVVAAAVAGDATRALHETFVGAQPGRAEGARWAS